MGEQKLVDLVTFYSDNNSEVRDLKSKVKPGWLRKQLVQSDEEWIKNYLKDVPITINENSPYIDALFVAKIHPGHKQSYLMHDRLDEISEFVEDNIVFPGVRIYFDPTRVSEDLSERGDLRDHLKRPPNVYIKRDEYKDNFFVIAGDKYLEFKIAESMPF